MGVWIWRAVCVRASERRGALTLSSLIWSSLIGNDDDIGDDHSGEAISPTTISVMTV